MTYCKGRVGRLQTGGDGAFTHMNTGILDKLDFPYPPLSLQGQFQTVLQNIESQKQQAESSLEQSEALFQSLLQRAFKGEL
jgi:type I restriction enzyme S subunit